MSHRTELPYKECLPYRQHDRRWQRKVMWDRKAVMEIYTKYNHRSKKAAEELLRAFPNNIRNVGCQITSLAMVLTLLGKKTTPLQLHNYAVDGLYYTKSGLALATLYADLVQDVSQGEVQLCVKEEYLSGKKGWGPVYANESAPLRAYFALPEKQRGHYAAMIKNGTYDDSIASHFVVADPRGPESLDETDIPILDPAMPDDARTPWTLSCSAEQIKNDDPELKEEWLKAHIKDLQIAGVWLFARWQSKEQESLITPLKKYL